jgi:hypothetical protein
VNGGDYYDPPTQSLFFAVDGKPVCVTEDLVCYVFGPAEIEEIDIESIRGRAVSITRDRFDELRATMTTKTLHG